MVVEKDRDQLDGELGQRLERLKALIQESALVAPSAPLAAAGAGGATTSPGGSKGSSIMSSAPNSRGLTRAEQIKESAGLVGRLNKQVNKQLPGGGKFNMLKYTSIGTAYGEEPDHFEEEALPASKVLEFDDLDFGDEIGTGAFSWVYSGTWKEREVAIKKLSFEALEVDDFLTMFKKEVALLAILDHPNVVDFVGVVTFPSYYMVTGYMHEGALDEILHDADTELPWARRMSLLHDVALGMNYLHSCVPRVIHRDLKCGNVLVNKDWRAAVTDFGLSVTKRGRMDPADLKFAYNIRMSLESAMTGRHQSYVKPLEGPVGTFPYIAPELLETKPYNEMVDVYSYAMVLWHVLTRQPPWSGLTNSVFEAKELTEVYRPAIPPWCPEPYRKLIEQCWDPDAYKRPTFQTIINEVGKMKEELPSPIFPPESE